MKNNRYWWVRHAPVINNNNCCYGNNEVECDLSDERAFLFLAKILPKNSYTFSSLLNRTVKTFHTTCNFGYSYKKYKKDNCFAEQNIGDWAGMKYSKLEEITKKNNVYSPNWLCDPNYTPPNGESLYSLYLRIYKKINLLNNEFSNTDIVIFSHGGPIRTAIAIASSSKLENSIMFQIDNLSVTRLDIVNNVWKIKYINYTVNY